METTTNEPVLTGEAAQFAAATAHIPDTISGAPEGTQAQETGTEVQGQPVEQPGLSPEMMATAMGLPFALVAMLMGEGAEFWNLSEFEKKQLGELWHGILNPIWIRWIGEAGGPLVLAVSVTAMTVVPRVLRERARRASLTASTETAKSGDSSSSPDQPAPVNQLKPIDLSAMQGE